MQMMRFDPIREMERLQSEVNRLFEGYNTPETRAARGWAPAVDVRESEDALTVQVELPGMKQEDIDIELTGDTLTVRGERKSETEDARGRVVRTERAWGAFSRSFTLATPIQSDRVSATYRDGILEITLPKSEETRPRKVQVIAA